MQRSHLIILISTIAVFTICMAAIIINKTKTIEETQETNHNYASQTSVESTTETSNYQYVAGDDGITYEHMERLTFAQQTVRLDLDKILNVYFIETYHKNDKVISAVISDISTDEFVYVDFTFIDVNGLEIHDTAVVVYDTYSKNTFTRCLSLDDFNAIYKN